MNILSLFDGISCAQIALERAGFKVDKYFASEIDKHAIKVTQHNYPNTIQLGDVTKIKALDLPKIDLLIGGSPCQGFSTCGKGLNFNGSRSKLFFEYIRLLKECKPTYFILENVRMKKEWQNVISKYIGVEPILINSALVSAQNRNRLYWTNISNIPQPKDKGITVRNILDTKGSYRYVANWEAQARRYAKNFVRFSFCDAAIDLEYNADCKAAYILAKHATLKISGYSYKILCDDGRIRFTTILEKERLQTILDNYTNSISIAQRHKVLGNCFTVDVIVHILSYLSERHGDA